MKRAILLALIALPALTSCSYRIGPAEGVEGAWVHEARTVAVPIFDNRSYRQGLEFDLTRHFVEELHLHAPVSVLQSGREADAKVIGSILRVHDRVRQEDREDQVIASQVEMTVEVEVVFRDGRRVGPLRHIEVAEYVPFRGQSRETATAVVVRDMARELVLRIGRARPEASRLDPPEPEDG